MMKPRPEHLAVQEADAARFRWWFSRDDGKHKAAFIPSYLRGIREGWSLDEWRAAIDKAMQEEDKAEDEDLNRKLRASLSRNDMLWAGSKTYE